MEEEFKQHGVVSDIIDAAPKQQLSITYESGIEVKPGCVLTPTQVQHCPKVVWQPDSDTAYYTLIFIDPDAPSRAEPTFGQILHWLVVNIPGNKVNEGETVSDYIGSGPPEGSGHHRYIYLLFKQNNGRQDDFKEIPRVPRIGGKRENRIKWNVRNFAKKYNLGEPVAGNFYRAEYDDYVPILRAELAKGQSTQ